MAWLLDPAIGTAISEALRLVVTVQKRRGDFRGNFETLENTLGSALLTLQQIQKLNIVLNRSEENTEHFIKQLNQGVSLVEKCTQIPYWKTYKYSKKLAELDECIEKFFNIGVQGCVAVNTLRNGVGIQEINDKFDFVLRYLNIKYEPEIRVKEILQGPSDEFERIHDDDEIETDSSDEFSSWVTVTSLTDSVLGFHVQPLELISAPESLQDPEISTLGAGISELLNVVVAVAERTQNFESNLGSLRKTLESVEPIFNEAEKLGILFNRPKEEIHQFKDQVNRGVDVVCKCSNIPDWKKHSYSKKLIELDTSILKFFQIEVQGLMLVNTISLDDQYAMTVSCQPAVPKGGCSRIPDALVKPPNEGAEVVWKHEKTELVDGESMSGTNRVLLDHLPTSLETSEEMDSSSEGRYNDLISFLEVQRIPDKSAHCLDLKDMSSYDNFVGPSTRNLPHVVCTRGEHVGLKMEEASYIKKRLHAIRELSSEIIGSQASVVNASPIRRGKGCMSA
ncbi:hypothetical protein DCAR_0103662 [Daucus carota subsp. sativus]|uniref:RPW8 domain-containing protein n=1 Tax=Daucus carota subsp. sativus TaxID=79200 RepID=A0A166I6E8_DAUCS|nr:hypothetical protein DCAR_0103662 [Daucus carota subsp. sativus]